MANTTSRRARKKSAAQQRGKRRGIPVTVYFSENLSKALSAASEGRRVGKSTIIRIAVERLLHQLESGQLELPLGI